MQSELLTPLVLDRLQKCSNNEIAIDLDSKKIKGYTTAGRIKKALKFNPNPSRKGFSDLTTPNRDTSETALFTSFVPSLAGIDSLGVLGFSDLAPITRTKSELAYLSQNFQDILKNCGVDYVG